MRGGALVRNSSFGGKYAGLIDVLLIGNLVLQGRQSIGLVDAGYHNCVLREEASRGGGSMFNTITQRRLLLQQSSIRHNWNGA